MKKTKIKIGEIFEVEGKLYVVVKPKSASDTVNDHGQIVCLLKPL